MAAEGSPGSRWVIVDSMNMSEIRVRVVDESEWSLYRDIRWRAVAESLLWSVHRDLRR